MKFRVWDSENNIYRHNLLLRSWGSLYEIEGGDIPIGKTEIFQTSSGTDYAKYSYSNYILEFSIGISDIENNSIYAGDIVEIRDFKGNMETFSSYSIEDWEENNEVKFAAITPYKIVTGIDIGLIKSIKVIGNIHENPELLENKQ